MSEDAPSEEAPSEEAPHDGEAIDVAPEPDEPLADVFDWPIEPATMPQVVSLLRGPSDHPRLIVTVNVALMWMASVDPRLSRIVQNSSLRVADGMGVIWSWRALGRRLPERVAGIDLMVELIAAAARDGRSIYLLGAKQEVLDHLTEILVSDYPGLKIAGSHHGYFVEGDHNKIVGDIKASGADLLFIGMPSPFKEFWAAEHLDEVGADLVMGVGGSFDVISGFVPRAPRPMQKAGLEWAWRLACEPRRMWKRYAVTNAWLARRVVTALLRRRRAR